MAGIKVIYKPIDNITPYANNPRRNEKAVGAVAKSIKEFGFLNPIVIDNSGVIVAGHTRYLAARRLQLETVPCIVADDLSDEQVRAFRLADNRVAEIAEWDKEKLHQELADLKGIFDMSEYGFRSDAQELAEKLAETSHKCPKCGYEW